MPPCGRCSPAALDMPRLGTRRWDTGRQKGPAPDYPQASTRTLAPPLCVGSHRRGPGFLSSSETNIAMCARPSAVTSALPNCCHPRVPHDLRPVAMDGGGNTCADYEGQVLRIDTQRSLKRHKRVGVVAKGPDGPTQAPCSSECRGGPQSSRTLRRRVRLVFGRTCPQLYCLCYRTRSYDDPRNQCESPQRTLRPDCRARRLVSRIQRRKSSLDLRAA